jgi:hypothetical protein
VAEIASSVVTAVLMLLMLRAAATLVDPRSALAARTVPWAAAVLTGLAVVGLVVQATWKGAMAALDDDPARTGWWRPFTAVFLQNGGVAGTTWNLVTLALVAAAACLWWGDVLTVLLFAAGALLPGLVDGAVGTLLRALPGSSAADPLATAAADPRNFVGSSGATYFLAATLAAAVVLHRSAPVRERLLAGSVPVLGAVAFVVVDDAHGLVTAQGFLVGLAATAVVTQTGRYAGRSRARPRTSR